MRPVSATAPPASLRELPPPPPGRAGFPWTEAAPPLPALAPGQDWPRLSIVTPSYNQAAYLEETIRSLLLQGYPDLEYFIQDGGSTDGSVAIIERYAPWLTSWVSARDRGQSDAINQGFARATGEFVAWLNSDDTYTAGALAGAGQQLLAHQDAVVVHGDAYLIARDSRRIGKAGARDYDRQYLLEQANSVPQPSAFIRRAALEQVGGLDETLHYAMDYDLWLRLGAIGSVVYVPEAWSNQRIHAAAKTAGDERHYAEVRAVIQKHGGPGLPVGFGEWLARIHLPLAWQAFARGDDAAGKAELSFVLQNVPAWRRAPQLAAEVAAQAWALDLGLTGHDNIALDFVARVTNHLPAEAEHPATVEREALAAVHTAAAFRHAARGEGADVRYHVTRAWTLAARSLTNGGLWAIARRSFVKGPPSATFSLEPARARVLVWLKAWGLLPVADANSLGLPELAAALRLARLWDVGALWPAEQRAAAAAVLATHLNEAPVTRDTVLTLQAEGVAAPAVVAFAAQFTDPAYTERWLARLDWSQTRASTSRLADVAMALLFAQRQTPNARTETALQHLQSWVAAHQHTDSGAWTFGHDIKLAEALIAATHCLPLYQAMGQALPEPEWLIEAVLKLQQFNGLFGAAGQVDAYTDARLLQLLAVVSHTCDHRAADVRAAARFAAAGLLRRQPADVSEAWLLSLALAAIATRWPELVAPTTGWTLVVPAELAGPAA